MLKITNILNPLTGGATTTEHVWKSGQSLAEYIDYADECIVQCGQEVIDMPLDKIFPADTEEFTVMPIPEGGDKDSWRVLGLTVATGIRVVAMVPGAPVLWAKYGQTAALVGGAAIPLFLKGKPEDHSRSQSYAWSHRSSATAAEGIAMPVIYGKARVRPIIKNRYVTIKDDKQRLYALYGLAAHKVDVHPLTTVKVFTTLTPYYTGDIVTGNPLYDDYEPGKTYKANRNLFTSSQEVNFLYAGLWTLYHGTASFSEDIIINGRAISDYNRDVEWETRPGLPEQIGISGFTATYSNSAQNEVLYLDEPEINGTTANIRYSALANRVRWRSHYLLYKGTEYLIQADAKAFTSEKTYYIYYNNTISTRKYYMTYNKPTAITAHLIARFYTTLDGIEDLVYYYRTNTPISTDWYSPVLTLKSIHNIELTFEFPYGLLGGIAGEKNVSGTCRLFAQYREYTEEGTETWIDFDFGFADPDYVNDRNAVTFGAIVRKKPDIFGISIKAIDVDGGGDTLDYSKTYEMRVAAGSPRIVKLVNVSTIVYGVEDAAGLRQGFNYPGEPLLGIKALASGQINNDIDVQVDVERSKVWVYNTRHTTDRDGNASDGRWTQGDANIHAWAVYDILAQGHPDHPAYLTYGNDDAEAVYGCGIDKDRLDYESFRTWAEYTGGDDDGELNYELNIVFDTFITAWDAILRICQEGRGMVYPVGTKIYAFTDKPDDVSQVFTMGNITENTFVQKFLDESQRINMIEVNYFDAERGYEKTTIVARTSDWDTSTGLSIPTTITLYGTTSFDQAYSIARFMVRGTEVLNNAISFGVDVDSLAAQAGDVVEVQHDVLTDGEGGRIKSVDAVAGSITFDHTLTIASGTTYELVIYHNDSTIERKTVTGGSNTDIIVWGPAAWDWNTVPSMYEVYSFGVAGTHTKKYRIVDISRTNELMRTLVLVQYDATLYDSYKPTDTEAPFDDGQFTLPKAAISDTSVSEVADLLNRATNVQLQEIISMNRTPGDYESHVVVTWDTELGNPRGTWEVWFRDVDASDVNWEGTWVAGTYAEGEKVELDGKTYISLIDDNQSSPFESIG